MATKIAAPEPDLPNIRKHLGARRPIWQLFGWAGAAVIALTAVVLISQTEAGSKRLRLALDSMSDPARVIAQISPRPDEMKTASNAETQRLAQQVRELTAGREKLNARIATLEHSLEDMTGSIKQQTAQLAAARAAMMAPPMLNAPATTASVPAKTSLPALTPITPKVVTEPAPSSPVAEKTEEVPIPPVRVAAAPANEPAAEPPPAKIEFGVDLGAASSMEALRMHWAAVKANYGPLLAGLHPHVAEHARQPSGVIYRLVAGPLPNAAEAAKLCARFPVTRTGCRPAKFDGAELAAH
jgi:Tfp pilus assembly protein FimV